MYEYGFYDFDCFFGLTNFAPSLGSLIKMMRGALTDENLWCDRRGHFQSPLVVYHVSILHFTNAKAARLDLFNYMLTINKIN
jgi:hypothetical protein